MNQIKNRLILCSILVATAVLFSTCEKKRTIYCKHVEKLGISNINKLWLNIAWQQIGTPKPIPNHKDSFDLDAKFKSCWDKEGIYFLFRIQDNLLFDISKLKNPLDIPMYDETDCVSIIFGLDSIKKFNFIRYSSDSILIENSENVTCKLKKENFSSIIEIRIPWNSLPGFNYNDIKKMPFEVYIYDNDNDATEGVFPVGEIDSGVLKMRRTILSWSQNKYVNLSTGTKTKYGELKLEP